jgi:hypothetical protein
MASMQTAVTIAGLVAGGVCFVLYVAGALVDMRLRFLAARPNAAPALARTAVIEPRALSVEEAGRLIEALGRLTDSLSRASPALISLIGAILFFAIAAVSSGALRGATPAG